MMQIGKVSEFSTYRVLDWEGVLDLVANVLRALGYMEAGFGFWLEEGHQLTDKLMVWTYFEQVEELMALLNSLEDIELLNYDQETCIK